MKHLSYSRLGVATLSVLSSVALISFSGCSTSGGKQEPVVEHHATNETLKGSVAEVNDYTKSAFKDLGIQTTGTKMTDSGKQSEITGKSGDKTVTVDMKEAGKGTTQVEVIAREGNFQWNEDYANTVLSKISEKS